MLDIPPWLVGLSNGKSAFAIRSGSAKLGVKLALKNVLYIPQLMCHLLSVSQLLKQLNGLVAFTYDFFLYNTL